MLKGCWILELPAGVWVYDFFSIAAGFSRRNLMRANIIRCMQGFATSMAVHAAEIYFCIFFPGLKPRAIENWQMGALSIKNYAIHLL